MSVAGPTMAVEARMVVEVVSYVGVPIPIAEIPVLLVSGARSLVAGPSMAMEARKVVEVVSYVGVPIPIAKVPVVTVSVAILSELAL